MDLANLKGPCVGLSKTGGYHTRAMASTEEGRQQAWKHFWDDFLSELTICK